MAPIGPDKELINRAFRIKPVVRDRDGVLQFIEPIDIYEKIYSMDGLQTASGASGHIAKLADIDILMPATLWGGEVGGPTIAQVLPQIPPEWLDQTVAFQAHMADDREGENGFVRAKAELYGGALPQSIKDQPVVAWRKTYTQPFPMPEEPQPQFNTTGATTLGDDVPVMKPLRLKPGPQP